MQRATCAENRTDFAPPTGAVRWGQTIARLVWSMFCGRADLRGSPAMQLPAGRGDGRQRWVETSLNFVLRAFGGRNPGSKAAGAGGGRTSPDISRSFGRKNSEKNRRDAGSGLTNQFFPTSFIATLDFPRCAEPLLHRINTISFWGMTPVMMLGYVDGTNSSCILSTHPPLLECRCPRI